MRRLDGITYSIITQDAEEAREGRSGGEEAGGPPGEEVGNPAVAVVAEEGRELQRNRAPVGASPERGDEVRAGVAHDSGGAPGVRQKRKRRVRCRPRRDARRRVPAFLHSRRMVGSKGVRR